MTFRFVLYTFFFLVVFRQLALADHEKCPPPWVIRGNFRPLPKNIFTATDDLASDSNAVNAVNTIEKFFTEIDSRLNDPDEYSGSPRSWNSTVPGTASVDINSRHIGFGPVEKLAAIIHFSSKDAERRKKRSEEVYAAAVMLDKLTIRGAQRARDRSPEFEALWMKNQSIISNRWFQESFVTNFCDVVKATGYRIDGKWHLRASFTDLEPLVQSDVTERNVYSQVIYSDGKSVNTRSVRLSQCDENGVFSRQDEGKGFIATWRPTVSWSDFITVSADDNPAMQRARSSGGVSAENFKDVDTVSEIAIFLLPVAMALIPTALLNEVSSGATLFLLLGIDILSAIPIFVKSLELLQVSRSRNYFTETVFFGGPNLEGTAAAEVYVVRCGLNERLRNIGVGLLPFIFFLTAVSIILDVLCYRWLVRLKRIYVKKKGLGHNILDAPRAGVLWYRKAVKLL